MMTYDVVVIGAGLSGLTSAYRLLQYDGSLKVLVLEAKDRVGGRTLTTKLRTKNGEDFWDLGGQWVGRPQTHVMNLIKELGLEVHEQYSQGAKYARLSDGQVHKYHSSLPKISLWSLLDIYLFVNKVNKLSQEITLDDTQFDGQTVEDFKQRHCWTKGAKELFDTACGVIFGAHPSQMSLLFFLHYCQCAGGVEPILESGYGSGQGGAQSISNNLIEIIGEENVWLNEPVIKISQDDNNSNIMVNTANGRGILSKYIIMSIPPHEALKITFHPALPDEKVHQLRHMPVGHLIKFVVTYSSAFWRENGLSGEVVSFDNFPTLDKAAGAKRNNTFLGEAPVSLVYDATTANGNAALVGFISGMAATKWMNIVEEEQIAEIIKFLETFFGNEVKTYLDIAIKDWSKESWNGGCPINYAISGTYTSYGDCLKTSVGRIHWAGTETGSHWCGFMNGAVQSGTRAAEEVLKKISPSYIPTYNNITKNKDSLNDRSSYDFWTLIILGAIVIIAFLFGMILL